MMSNGIWSFRPYNAPGTPGTFAAVHVAFETRRVLAYHNAQNGHNQPGPVYASKVYKLQ